MTAATNDESLLPASSEAPSTRQRAFARYVTGGLIDVAVLGLFAEYWDLVSVSSFTIILLAGVLLQILLKLTIWVEHLVAKRFEGIQNVATKTTRVFAAWAVLFGSKFVILEALSVAFSDEVQFTGPLHGLIALIVVVVVMLLVEEVIVRIYRRLK